jgi:hypothetical protein
MANKPAGGQSDADADLLGLLKNTSLKTVCLLPAGTASLIYFQIPALLTRVSSDLRLDGESTFTGKVQPV